MNRIYYLLDESGSMIERQQTVLCGIREFLDDQRNLQTQCRVSLYTFNHALTTVFEDKDIADVPDVPIESYKPRGTTALLDAMGHVLEKITCTDDDTRHVLIVLSDGEENNSRFFTRHRIQQLIEDKKDLQIIYVGSNQDAILNGTGMGIATESCLDYSDDHLLEAMRCTSHAVNRYQRQETPSIMYTELERQYSAGKKTMEW